MTETVPTDLSTIGARIRQARRDAGYRNAESLAVALDVGQRTVQRWETGAAEPSIKRLREIAALTSTSVEYLICGDRDTPDGLEAA